MRLLVKKQVTADHVQRKHVRVLRKEEGENEEKILRRDILKVENMTDYEWLTSMNLCHRCRKEKTAPGKKFCFDCLEIIKKENARRYDSEKAKQYQQRRREIYREKKANGICVRCNKQSTHGMYCYEHYIKERRRSIKRANDEKEKRHEKGLVSEKRKENGLCLWCGEKSVNGTNACARHVLIFSEAGRKGKRKEKVVSGLWELKKSKNLSCT